MSSAERAENMKLQIDVSGNEPSRLPAAERAWTEFEAAVELPFDYEKPANFAVCHQTDVSQLAEVAVKNGIATLRLTPALLDCPPNERTSTLLHESLHIASFVGPLREMYEAAVRFDPVHLNELMDRMMGGRIPKATFRSRHPQCVCRDRPLANLGRLYGVETTRAVLNSG